MKKIILLFIALFIVQINFAQTNEYKILFDKGNNYIQEKDYIKAFEYFDMAKDETNDTQLKNKAIKKKEYCKQKIKQQQNDLQQQLIISERRRKEVEEAIKEKDREKERADREKERADRNEFELQALGQKVGIHNANETNEIAEIITDTVTAKRQNIDPQDIDLSVIRTPVTGKTIKDFNIPESMVKDDKELVDLIIRSESMNDGERQYWFNLTKTMNLQQVEKLRDILSRERKKLAEIEAKYSEPEELKVGIRLFNNKEYDKALKQFFKIKEDFPDKVNLNTWIARIYVLKNDYGKAEEYILMIKGAKYISEGYGTIGNEFYKIKNYNDALKSYLNAIIYDPTNSSAFYSAGVNYYLLNISDKAKEYFEKACVVTKEKIEKDSSNYSPYFSLSFYSLFANKPQEAITAAKKSLVLAPEKKGVYTNLALGYVLNNEYEKAKDIYVKWKDKHFPNDERFAKEIFLQDIKDLEEAGITHNDFKKVKELLE